MKYKLLIMVILSIILIPRDVYAEDVTISLDCPTSVNLNQDIECTLGAVVNTGVLAGVEATYNFNNSFDYLGFIASNSFPSSTSSQTKLVASNFDGVTGNVQIGKLRLKVKSSVVPGSNITLGFGSFIVTNTSNYITCNIPSKTMYVLNNVNTLNSLSIDGISLSPAFSKEVTSYSANVASDKATASINSILTSNTSSYVEGFGNRVVNINYGENRFLVKVKAENGSVNTYTIVLVRPDNRSTNNNLTSLSLTNGKINFSANTLNYNVTVENDVTTVTINAVKADNKATINGGGKVNLNVGLNTFKINVTAENGSIKTYTINITRKNSKGGLEVLSNDNSLKTLTIDEIPFEFNKDNTNYNISVKNGVETATIKYEVNDSKASVKLVGNKDLAVGNNVFEVVVTSEEGETKTYSIIITRKDERVDVEYDTEKILESLDEYKIIYVEVPNATKDKIVDMEVLNYLKEHKKTIYYEIVNADKGLIYSVMIDGTNLGNITKDLNLSLDFMKQNQQYVLDAIKNKKVMYLNFDNDGELPGEVVIKLYTKEYFANSDKLYLYYNNTDKLALELVEDNILIDTNFINIKVSHTSSYLLTNDIIKNVISKETIMLIIIGVETIIILSGVTYVLIKKYKKPRVEAI